MLPDGLVELLRLAQSLLRCHDHARRLAPADHRRTDPGMTRRSCAISLIPSPRANRSAA